MFPRFSDCHAVAAVALTTDAVRRAASETAVFLHMSWPKTVTGAGCHWLCQCSSVKGPTRIVRQRARDAEGLPMTALAKPVAPGVEADDSLDGDGAQVIVEVPDARD